MGAYEVWTDRLTTTFRALGLALMVVVLGWILVALAMSISSTIGKGVVGALVAGYLGGRLHAGLQTLWNKPLRTFRADQSPIDIPSREVPPVAYPPATPKGESDTLSDAQGASVKAFVEREMAKHGDEELAKAADLAARQLQQAIEIVEGKVGKDRADPVLVAAVLSVIAGVNERRQRR